MLFLVLAWLQNYTNLLANARRKSQEPGTSERDEQEYACFIVSLLLTIGSSPPRACSVTVSYKPPMLVTRVRLPACAQSLQSNLCNAIPISLQCAAETRPWLEEALAQVRYVWIVSSMALLAQLLEQLKRWHAHAGS